jgi:hypothetical protein
MTRREREIETEQMPKQIDKLDTQLFSNYSPQQALAFANRFNVVEGFNRQMKDYADWVEELRTGWYQQRKYLQLCKDKST